MKQYATDSPSKTRSRNATKPAAVAAPSASTPQPVKAPADPTLVYVSNLPYEISATFVSDAFWQGAQLEVAKAEVLTMGLPHGHKKTCGLALVKMKSEEDAQTALEKLDGYKVLNRPMIIRTDKFVEDDPTYEHGSDYVKGGASKVPVR